MENTVNTPQSSSLVGREITLNGTGFAVGQKIKATFAGQRVCATVLTAPEQHDAVVHFGNGLRKRLAQTTFTAVVTGVIS